MYPADHIRSLFLSYPWYTYSLVGDGFIRPEVHRYGVSGRINPSPTPAESGVSIISDILAIAIAEKKATMKLITQGCQTVEDVEKKIDEYFDTVAKYAKELEER